MQFSVNSSRTLYVIRRALHCGGPWMSERNRSKHFSMSCLTIGVNTRGRLEFFSGVFASQGLI
eukprot:172774-Prorocentrum_minimum.AAC.5